MKKFLSLMFGALFLTTACTKTSSDSLAGREFKLAGTDPDIEITLGFSANEPRFFGKSAVNRYFGSYKVDNGNLTFSPAGSTMMAGPQKAMEAEQKYLKALSDIKSYRFNNNKLILSGENEQSMVFDEIAPSAEKQN